MELKNLGLLISAFAASLGAPFSSVGAVYDRPQCLTMKSPWAVIDRPYRFALRFI